jgi:hypothetical protein
VVASSEKQKEGGIGVFNLDMYVEIRGKIQFLPAQSLSIKGSRPGGKELCTSRCDYQPEQES